MQFEYFRCMSGCCSVGLLCVGLKRNCGISEAFLSRGHLHCTLYNVHACMPGPLHWLLSLSISFDAVFTCTQTSQFIDILPAQYLSYDLNRSVQIDHWSNLHLSQSLNRTTQDNNIHVLSGKWFWPEQQLRNKKIHIYNLSTNLYSVSAVTGCWDDISFPDRKLQTLWKRFPATLRYSR